MVSVSVARVRFSGEKIWNHGDNTEYPQSMTIHIHDDRELVWEQEVTAGDNWEWQSDLLPKYDDDDVEITYRVHEVAIPGYQDETTYPNSGADRHVTITNTYIGFAELNVTKQWDDADNRDGIRPDQITVVLFVNGEPSDPVQTLTLTKEMNWEGKFTGLEIRDDLVYSVDELSVPAGYQKSESTHDGPYDWEITNKYEAASIEVEVTKSWIDANNEEGMRPNVLDYLHLLVLTENGEAYRFGTLN